MLELNDQTLRLLEVVGVWIASIGTLSAVIVSLWLARLDNKVRLSVLAAGMIQVEPGMKQTPKIVFFQVTNVGRRPATLTNLGWEAGWFNSGPLKKVHMLQLLNNPGSHKIPCELTDGQAASFTIPVESPNTENWYDRFVKGGIPRGWFYRWTLRIVAHTSHGESFRSKPSKSFLDEIAKADERVAQQASTGST